MIFALALDQKINHFLHFAVLDDPAEANRANVAEGNFHLQAAGFDFQEIILLDGGAIVAAADLLDDSHAVVRVNYFVANPET